MCGKMPIVIDSVGDQGQRVEHASRGLTTARSSASRKKGATHWNLGRAVRVKTKRRGLRRLLGRRTLRPGVVVGCAGPLSGVAGGL
jgi:hypothetical protein